ncbi:VCBS repeat-containing protein [Stieleria sp. JC731]|uniref:FG-GAP repeat domain-containing protein n=1 Tax=Pirellulaceae TaxID=2691357 RepID=UPI001E520DE9|nr:VCBS repeat-containing protein [Stieleria sp. JC731]MCC9601657.1 VCBS repeat-containing protein [Stieleria sp. JC731]
MVVLGAQNLRAEDPLQFDIRMLALDANEGIAAGDVDDDGVTDLIAGRAWFKGGDWAARPLRNIDDWNGYVQSNGDYLFDVNADGKLDVVAGSFIPSEVHWYENPGEEALRLGKQWPQHLLLDTKQSQNEGQLFQDIDGDGRPEWIVNSWKKNCPAFIYRLVEKDSSGGKADGSAAKFELVGHALGQSGNGHGVAVGDLNNDGKLDLMVGQGWYQQPANDPWSQPWQFHADWDLHSSLPMIVEDLDQDGDSDVIIGNGHNYGLYWWEQVSIDSETGKIEFKEHMIDDRYSQPHTLAWADLDNDGQKELITGKRYYAHNSNDPGGNEAPCLYYYRWNQKSKSFTRFTIDEGHVGCGLQIVVEDLNGDSKVDLAVAGKSGTYLLLAK